MLKSHNTPIQSEVWVDICKLTDEHDKILMYTEREDWRLNHSRGVSIIFSIPLSWVTKQNFLLWISINFVCTLHFRWRILTLDQLLLFWPLRLNTLRIFWWVPSLNFKFSVYIVSFTCKHATMFSVIDYKICTLTHK